MGLAKRSIVHVDDSRVILEKVRDLLSELDFEVASVDDPTRVPEVLEETGCRILVSDLEMPQMTGLDLLKKIKGDDGGISVIMLTGAIGPTAIAHSRQFSLARQANLCDNRSPSEHFSAGDRRGEERQEKADHEAGCRRGGTARVGEIFYVARRRPVACESAA
ncbi:response regulator [Blastopirellula retiformator]|uniref:response regulator n=1 Tax=Blastopirellula retiformator TaxID=2527970 RepID=UPI0011B41051